MCVILEAFQKRVWGFVEFNPKKNLRQLATVLFFIHCRGSAPTVKCLGGSEFPFQCIPHIPDSHLPLASPGRGSNEIFSLYYCVSVVKGILSFRSKAET